MWAQQLLGQLSQYFWEFCLFTVQELFNCCKMYKMNFTKMNCKESPITMILQQGCQHQFFSHAYLMIKTAYSICLRQFISYWHSKYWNTKLSLSFFYSLLLKPHYCSNQEKKKPAWQEILKPKGSSIFSNLSTSKLQQEEGNIYFVCLKHWEVYPGITSTRVIEISHAHQRKDRL